jgi:hypothetical protein
VINSATTASILTQDLVSPKHKILASNLPKSHGLFLDDDSESRNSTKQRDIKCAILQTRLDRAISSSSAAGLNAIRHYHSGMNHDNATLDVDDESVGYSCHLQDDDEDTADQSTLCPTIVAADRKPKFMESGDHSSTREHYSAEEGVGHYNSVFAQNFIEYSDNQQSASLAEAGNHIKEAVLSPELDVSRQSTSIFRGQHDISHVVVHVTSPSETLLTMDATMLLHDVDAVSQSSRLVNDAASLGEETPVLDRYRIIADDNSIGFKVIPNARGSQRKNMEDNRTTVFCEQAGSASRPRGVPKSVKFHETLEDENDEPQHYPKTPYPGQFTIRSSVERGGSSGIQKHSKFISLTSPFRYELDKENRKVLHASQDDNTGRQGDRPGANNSVSFSLQLPSLKTPSKSSEPLFRKTPYRASNTYLDDDQQGEGKGQGAAPHIAVCFEGRTPLKDTFRQYRKTPRPKIKERLSMESLKFHPETHLDTPAPVDHKTIQKTPRANKTLEHGHRHHSTRPAVHFEDNPDGLVSSTPLSERVTLRKTPYHGSARGLDETGGTNHNSASQWTAPKPANAASSTPKTIRFRSNNDTLNSPVSLASDITGLTAVSYSANQRELFPAIEPLDGGKVRSPVEPIKRPRKSASSLVAKIEEDEFEEADPLIKLQFTLEETNRAISALNGAAFLRKDGAGSVVRFTDTEAYKILRNVGFKRRRCKGLLMSLCHWRRLSMREEEAETDFGVATHYFEIIQ